MYTTSLLFTLHVLHSLNPQSALGQAPCCLPLRLRSPSEPLSIPCHHVLPRPISPTKPLKGDTLNIQPPRTLGRLTRFSLAHNTEVLASSSSSMNNVDMSDRILVPEPEADVDTVIEQQNAVGQMGATAGDEESKENLRAKLRNTLSKKQSLPGTFRPECGSLSFFVLALSAEGVDWSGFSQMSGFGRGKRGKSTELSELTATVRSLVPYLHTTPRVFTNWTVCSGRVSPSTIFRPHGRR
jgi:hypothetical protein